MNSHFDIRHSNALAFPVVFGIRYSPGRMRLFSWGKSLFNVSDPDSELAKRRTENVERSGKCELRMSKCEFIYPREKRIGEYQYSFLRPGGLALNAKPKNWKPIPRSYASATNQGAMTRE